MLMQPATHGIPALLRHERPQRPDAARSLGGLALILSALALSYVGYWPTLRSVAPQLAVDAAFLRAIEPDSPVLFDLEARDDPVWVVVDVGALAFVDDTGGKANLYRVNRDSLSPWVGLTTKLYRVNLESPDPWGGEWQAPSTYCVAPSTWQGWQARDIPVRVDRAISPLIAPIALGRELLLVVAGLTCAIWIATGPPRRRALEVAAMLAGVLLVVAPTIPAVELVRVRPWLARETLPAWRVHGTIALTVLMVLSALRLQCRVPTDQARP